MPKYLCLQRTLVKPSDEPPASTQMQDMFARFNEWRERFSDNIDDMGGKLGAGTLVTEAPATDGPFVEVKELVGGYMIVTADTLEEAVEVAGSMPGLVSDRSGVEVIEIRTP